jgi:hypothetical protein
VLLPHRAYSLVAQLLQILTGPVGAPVIHHHDLHTDVIVADEAALNGFFQKIAAVVGWNDNGNVRLHDRQIVLAHKIDC